MSEDPKCPKCGATTIRKMTNEGVPIWELRERYKVYCPNSCAYGISGGCYEVAEDLFIKNALISKEREQRGGDN